MRIDLTKIKDKINEKLNKNQGSANNGKFLKVGSDGEIGCEAISTSMVSNSTAYNNIKSGESTTLTLDNQKKINDEINTVLGDILTIINGTGE